MSEITAIRKQLKIKSGVVQRYEKEVGLYRKEVDELRQKLNKLTSDGAEKWDIDNTNRMIVESEKMVLDTETRLKKSTADLSDFVRQVEDKPGVADSEEFMNLNRFLVR